MLAGYFVPPITANYSFIVRADDYARIYLSTSTNPIGEMMIAQQSAACGDLVCNLNQISAPIELVGGAPYWFRGACRPCMLRARATVTDREGWTLPGSLHWAT